jgi:hypothetical protein
MPQNYNSISITSNDPGLSLRVLSVQTPELYHLNSQSTDEIGFLSTLHLSTGEFIIKNENTRKFYLVVAVECPCLDKKSIKYSLNKKNTEFSIKITGMKKIITDKDLIENDDPSQTWGEGKGYF